MDAINEDAKRLSLSLFITSKPWILIIMIAHL